jgi:hypothetical protein
VAELIPLDLLQRYLTGWKAVGVFMMVIIRDFFRPHQNKNGEWRFMVRCYLPKLCKTCGGARLERHPTHGQMFDWVSVHTSKCQFHPGICQHVACRKAWERAVKQAVKKRARELQASYRIGSCGASAG